MFISPLAIIDAVARTLEVDINKMYSDLKRPSYDARTIAIHLIKSINDNKTRHKEIVVLFGRPNHSFSVRSRKECEKLLANKSFKDKYDKCKQCVMNECEIQKTKKIL